MVIVNPLHKASCAPGLPLKAGSPGASYHGVAGNHCRFGRTCKGTGRSVECVRAFQEGALERWPVLKAHAWNACVVKAYRGFDSSLSANVLST